MFIEEIGRHLAVSSIDELDKSIKRDKGFWNVISIREPHVPRPDCLRCAKRFHEVLCEDIEHTDPNVASRPPRTEDVVGIFRFVDAHPGEPLWVHCAAGLSRSPAVALAIIVRGMVERKWDVTDIKPLVGQAIEILVQIRPTTKPNALFLRLCLEQFLSPEQAQELTKELINHLTLRKRSG